MLNDFVIRKSTLHRRELAPRGKVWVYVVKRLGRERDVIWREALPANINTHQLTSLLKMVVNEYTKKLRDAKENSNPSKVDGQNPGERG